MYDPLVQTHLSSGQAHPDSYWQTTIKQPIAEPTLPLQQNLEVDVAIIGAGYTGLSCALQLAKQHGIQAHILEANQVAWGCSGRNAGFVLPSTGRLSLSVALNKWGHEVTKGIHQEMIAGVNQVQEVIEQLIQQGVDCQAQSYGYLKLAHKPSLMNRLREQASFQQQMFNAPVQELSEHELKEQYVDDHQAYGAIKYQQGFGLNPYRLALGLAKLAQQVGVKIYSDSAVTEWQQQNNKQVLSTSQGRVIADKVVIATNGYTPKGFHSLVSGRTLPVLSQVIVTEPLSEEQIQACNFLTSNVVMDTRILKYYYRKLPDNRILFGGRGAITGKDAEDPYYAQRLLSVLKSSFPALNSIKYQYAWSGWICASLDDIPHVYQSDNRQVYYAMGYCGSGVSFSMQAGKRLADKIAGSSVPDIPFYQQELPKFPLPALRRLGQWGYFHYGRCKDKFF